MYPARLTSQILYQYKKEKRTGALYTSFAAGRKDPRRQGSSGGKAQRRKFRPRANLDRRVFITGHFAPARKRGLGLELRCCALQNVVYHYGCMCIPHCPRHRLQVYQRNNSARLRLRPGARLINFCINHRGERARRFTRAALARVQIETRIRF